MKNVIYKEESSKGNYLCDWLACLLQRAKSWNPVIADMGVDASVGNEEWFLCRLMVGCTPEYLSKKIEGKEMNLPLPENLLL